MSDSPYDWKPWLPEFHKPLDQRTKQEVPCMDTVSKSKPPEGTLTPSTVSLPSYQEWYDFFRQTLNIPEGGEAALSWAAKMQAIQTMRFLAKRGSPP